MMLVLIARHRRVLLVATLLSVVLIPFVVIAALLTQSTDDGIKSTTISVQGSGTNAPSVFTLGKKKELSYHSPTIKTNFEFDAIAPHWQETNTTNTNRTVSLRTSKDGQTWSGWTNIEVMSPQRDNAPHANEVFPETPLITLGTYFQYQVTLTGSSGHDAPVIKDMHVTYIDSRPSLAQQLKDALKNTFSSQAQATAAVPQVISRAGWGSPDPTGNAFKGTSQFWSPSYRQVNQVFIHHTVDSNYTSQVNGSSVVRAIWQYHTYTLGWGDIGYNYLVDESGNVYQGRAHGDNVIGGHVYDYNAGSMGVALIGCYQSNSSACQQLNGGNTQTPSSAMLNALTDLLAWKMTTYQIDPRGQHTFCKADGSGCLGLYTISGHGDAYPTSCPGNLVYQQLQVIRAMTTSKMANQYVYAAQQVNFPSVNLGDNNEVNVTMQFRNVGTAAWYNSGPNPVRLATDNTADHASAFRGSNWLSNNRAANLNEPSVAPGAIGSFTFAISSPANLQADWIEYFRLVAEGSTNFDNFFGLPIMTHNYSFSYNNQQVYTDSSKTVPIDLSNTSPGQTAWTTLSIRNTGNTTWYNSGAHPLTLGTDNGRDHSSGFCIAGWLSCNRPARLQETSVAPGASGTFEFPIHIPIRCGTYNEYFTPLLEGITWMGDPYIYYPITTRCNYSWRFVSQQVFTDSSKTTPIDVNALSPGQSVFFSVTAKNIGDTVWYNYGSYPLDLGASHPQDRVSLFYNPSWLTGNRSTRLKESSVPPGANGTFEATYTAPSGGSYREHLQPVAEGIIWLNDVGLYLPATVAGTYSWVFAGQQAYTDNTLTTPVDTMNLTPGQRFYFTVSAKNTGNATWYNSGNYPLALGTANPRDHNGILYDSSWINAKRPTALSEASIAPGQTGHFGAYYTAPNQAGSYREYLQPVADKITWLNDQGLYLPVTVK